MIRMYKFDDKRVLADLVHATEIYPSSKDRHFRSLKSKTGVDFGDMLFFDDERRNIMEVREKGR